MRISFVFALIGLHMVIMRNKHCYTLDLSNREGWMIIGHGNDDED